jgi:hypothetical protein
LLVWRGALDAVDDEDLDRIPGRNDPETELLFERALNRGSIELAGGLIDLTQRRGGFDAQRTKQGPERSQQRDKGTAHSGVRRDAESLGEIS